MAQHWQYLEHCASFNLTLLMQENMTTKRLHYISGLTLTVFVGLHLFNHLWSIAGTEKHVEMMALLRVLYRNIFIEVVLMIAVLVQILSGLKLFWKGRKTAVSSFDKLHRWTGLYLAIFLVIHVSSVLFGRVVLDLDTNFYYGVAGLNTFPFSLFFIPYYGLAILSFFGHVASIHNQKMEQSFLGWTPKRQAKAILALGFFVTVVIFYGLTNYFRGVKLPAEYNVLVGK
jgi:succinate dehydrogenase/fumarate reductase cytochrome b subunit